MNFIEFKNTFKHTIIISKSNILLHFPDFDNKNLTYRQKKWYIKKLVKNFYIFSDISINLDVLFHIANNIYSPNYISSYQALNYYNLIPEQVIHITWVSTNSTKNYQTPIWKFKYHNIKKDLFWGYNTIKFWEYSFYMADMEKTILDFFYFHKKYKTEQDIKGLRLNIDILKEKLNVNKIRKYLKIFNNKTLDKTIFILLHQIKNA